MNEYAAQMLSSDQVISLWPEIKPLLAQSCLANELTELTLTPEHILGLAVTDQCAVFGFFENEKINLVLVIQFSMDDGHKAASILAFAGNDMMLYKKLYWNYIVDWLKANDISYLDTYADQRMAKIFQKRFGFSQSAVCVRLPLKEQFDG